jgi:hypothetical protein
MIRIAMTGLALGSALTAMPALAQSPTTPEPPAFGPGPGP